MYLIKFASGVAAMNEHEGLKKDVFVRQAKFYKT